MSRACGHDERLGLLLAGAALGDLDELEHAALCAARPALRRDAQSYEFAAAALHTALLPEQSVMPLYLRARLMAAFHTGRAARSRVFHNGHRSDQRRHDPHRDGRWNRLFEFGAWAAAGVVAMTIGAPMETLVDDGKGAAPTLAAITDGRLELEPSKPDEVDAATLATTLVATSTVAGGDELARE